MLSPQSKRKSYMYKNGLNFHLFVNGRAIDEYSKDDMIYVEGRKGSNYEIVIINHTSIQKKLVVSVDGLNVLSGDANWERGYALKPGKTLKIPGWRVDASKVAKFLFSSVATSYNQHNDAGDKSNVGVIGMLVFNEKFSPAQYIPNPYMRYPYATPASASHGYGTWVGTPIIGSTTIGNSGGASRTSFTATASACQNHGGAEAIYMASMDCLSQEMNREVTQSVGTGWGAQQDFRTKTVHYDFETNACDTLMIYYDSVKGLIRRGINIKEKHISKQPNPFPGYRDGCPLPK